MASCVARAARATPARVVFYDKKRTPAAAARARVVVPRAADADADAAAPADAWLEARRADLSALTVEKGLKPLCRGYGLKLGGSKTALLERVLAHESANRAEFAPMEAVVEKASAWRNSRVVRVDEASARAIEEANAAKAERREKAGGWGRDEEDDYGDDVDEDRGWGSSWARREDEEESSTARMRDIEARYPQLRLADEKLTKDDLARRVAVVNGLRALAKEKEGYEADVGLHLEAIARAIDRGYRDMRGSALTVLQKEVRARINVSVDIDVQRGRFAVLVQVVGRGGTVEREYDDTKFFTFNIRRQNRMRTLIRYMSEEIKTGVARLATEDFVGQIGNVVDGTLRFRTETGSWMMDIKGGAAGVIPPEEQLLTYNDLPLKQGDVLSCFVLDVDQNLFTGREQTPVVLSMTIPALVGAIIREEVPEVASGEIEIKSIARMAGKVTKVAVALREGSTSWSNAVETCLGEDQSILRRIRERCGGEVVHFLPWSDDPQELIKSSLFPAEVLRVEESFPDGTQKRKFTAYVKEVDLRRAIGAGGNNVKLCASLTNAFVVIEVDETAGNTQRRGSFNDDLDDSYDSGFWGDDREDDFFGGSDAENFANNLNKDRFSEQTQSVQLDDLGWPDLDDFDDLPTTNATGRGPQDIPSVSELKTLGETFSQSFEGDDDVEEWDVGPGRPGLTTFGATGRPGVVGTALFFGDEAGEYDDDDDE